MKPVLLLLILMIGQPGQPVAQSPPASLPNPTLTPGATATTTREELCGAEFRSSDRNIPIMLKRQTFDRYGMRPESIGYNVDHLIPVMLGGSNAPKNLWPQTLSGEWNYQMKNRLERRLHKMVCSQTLTLETAQQEIARDWVGAYKKYMTKDQ